MAMKLFEARRTYLDWAASAPASTKATRAFVRTLAAFGNPSSRHDEGREARRILEEARASIARLLVVKADEIIFTSGATEANNIAIQGVVKPGSHALYLPSAHASVVETMRALEARGVAIEPLPVKDGIVDVGAMQKLLRPETALVSMDYVCGETGTIWNVRDVKHALLAGVLLHVDASQAPLVEQVERTRLAGDLITLDAGKLGGIHGAGILIAPRELGVAAIGFGGGQERDIRSGTQAVAIIAAFAAALEEAQQGRTAFTTRAQSARENLVRAIERIADLFVNQGKHGVPHILNLSLVGRDTDYLVALLNESGFAVSTKSACESDFAAGSRAVFALTNDEARAASTLRVSWGPSTSERDLERFARALVSRVEFLDASRA